MATELAWLGHGSWSIATGGHQVLLDPFLDDSPVAPVATDDVAADFILVSHGQPPADSSTICIFSSYTNLFLD